jgi:Zn ribbon nucleic-acid-binding protein
MTEQLETIEFKDGDRAYCRHCDGMALMRKGAKPSTVECMTCGTAQHAANLAVNGSHRRQPPTLRPEDMPADPPDVETNEYVVAAPVVLHPAYEYEMMAAI